MNNANLQPIYCPPAGFVVTEVTFEHLDHETLAAVLDAVLQKCLDLVDSLSIGCLRELELELHRLKVLLEHAPALSEVLLQQRLFGGGRNASNGKAYAVSQRS